MKERVNLQMLRAAGFILVICLPIVLAIYFSHMRAVSETRQHLRVSAQRVLDKTELVVGHVKAAQREAKSYSGEKCTLLHMKNMLNTMRSKLDVEDIIYTENNKLLCSTTFKPQKPFPLPEASYTGEPDISIFYYLDTPFYDGHKMTYMRRGNYIVIVNPQAYAEVMFEDGSHVWGMFDTVTHNFFSLNDNTSARLLGRLIQRPEKYFTEDGRIYSVVSSGKRPVAVIVSVATAQFNQEWYHQLTLTVPLGVICSIIIIFIWSRTLRQLNSPRRLLLRALSQGQLKLYYQPIVDLQSGLCIGAEALMRWFTFNGQSVDTETFITLAETEGLMPKISNYVIDTVFTDIGAYLSHHPDIYISMNLSAADFHSSKLVTILTEKAKQYTVAPRQIKIEVTERGFVDVTKVTPVIQLFRSAGFEIAIDDFGIGYSNLHNLQYLDVDILKIDKSFIDGLTTDRSSNLIVEHIIEMARSLEMKTIAEGVETPEQIKWLQERGIRYCQGWIFSKALSATDFIAWLARQGSFQAWTKSY